MLTSDQLESMTYGEGGLLELNKILSRLHSGNVSLTIDDQMFLSLLSSFLCNLSDAIYREQPYQIDKLGVLLKICNIMYNRTDNSVLPVEDGVYDLLLETYKRYNPNFQVGSDLIDVQTNVISENVTEHKVQPAIHFNTNSIQRDETRQFFEYQLKKYDENKFDKRDIYPTPVNFQSNDEYITKRTHNTKHNHPDLVGTLDKCKFVMNQDAIDQGVFDKDNVKILERDFFWKHIQAGIITENQEIEMILELKYDGISVEADCNKLVQSARTRGDTGAGEAADISPILKGYRFKRNNTIIDDTVGVKFEAIIKNSNLPIFNARREYNYANCRTAIIGLFGASDAYKYQDLITLIPLAVDRDQVPQVRNRMEEIELINELFQSGGEPLRYCYIKGNYQTCLYLIKKFAEEAKVARDYLDFMFDGIVVSYLDEDIRHRLGRENFINKYSMAVKFDPLSKLTRFLGYTFEVGQTGNICPMIHYAPVEFFGTIHTKSTGSSLKRFNDLGLKIGDIIEVTYTNDVMPYVTSIDCEENRQNTNDLYPFLTNCPECGSDLVLSDSGKTASCPNLYCPGRSIARMTNMLKKIGLKGFAESTILALGRYSFRELMEVPEDEMIAKIGPGNTLNFQTSIIELKCNPIEDYKIIGSLGFTGCAAQTWKLIFKVYSLTEFVKMIEENPDQLVYELSNVKGLGPNTIETILSEYGVYREDIYYIIHNLNVIDSKNISFNKEIRFTGCRNKLLEEQLCKLGHDANGNSSVTKKTDILIIPYVGFTSSKTSKISENTLVVAMDDFINNMERYLNQ